MRDRVKGKPPLDLYQAVREIACRLDQVIDYLNNNDPAFGDVYVRTFNGKTGDIVGVSSVNGQTGDVIIQEGGAVNSVNGKTGEVTLTGDDISISASDDQSISGIIDTLYGPDNAPPYPVTSVNTKTGAVKLKGSDISVSDGNDESVAAELAKKYDASNPPPYPVTSVNGQTGDVEISTGGGAVESVNGKTGAVLLTASDINATAGGTVQQNINTFSSDIKELGNEVNSLQQGVSNLETEVDGKYSASNPPPYPVTSVNDKTGAVTGLYSAENPPPYPVTSVNGKTGNVVGLYGSDNPPPYPVVSVLGLTGSISALPSTITVDESEIAKNNRFNPFDVVYISESGSLPAGNSIIRNIIMNQTHYQDFGQFLVRPMATGLIANVTGGGNDSTGRYYIKVSLYALVEVSLLNAYSIQNLSNIQYTIFDVLRYVP